MDVYSLELSIEFTTKYDVTLHRFHPSIYCEIVLPTEPNCFYGAFRLNHSIITFFNVVSVFAVSLCCCPFSSFPSNSTLFALFTVFLRLWSILRYKCHTVN